MVHKRLGDGVDGALSTKMKQSTRNNNKVGEEEESFIRSFDQPASDNYEDLERRIQSAKLEKRTTHQLMPLAGESGPDDLNQPSKAAKHLKGKVVLDQPSVSLENNSRLQPNNVNLEESDTYSSNYSFIIGKSLFISCCVLEADRVQVLIDFGFPQEYVLKTLQENEANYCTTGYYLLGLDQNY